MTRALAWAPKCNCRTCRIRRMDSLSVGIPSPPSIATGKRWSQVNTDLLNDLRSRRPSLPPGGGRDQIGRVAAIRSVGWPPSGWNTWPPWIGIHSTAQCAQTPGEILHEACRIVARAPERLVGDGSHG